MVTPTPQSSIAVSESSQELVSSLERAVERCAGLRWAGASCHAADVLALVELRSPDILLLGAPHNGENCAAVVRSVRERSTQTRIVVMAEEAVGAHVHGAVEAGVSGYLVKDEALPELIHGVLRVAEGNVVLSPSAAQALRTYRSDEPIADA